MAEKSTHTFQQRQLMRLGKSTTDNWLLVIGLDLLITFMWKHHWASTTALWLTYTLTAAGGYGWLLATHPDQAAALRRAMRRPVAALALRVWAIGRKTGSHLTRLDGDRITYSDAVAETKATVQDLKVNPRSVAAATRQWESLFDGWAKEPIGKVQHYEYDEATGNKRWIIALPPPLTADQFAGACMGGLVNKLGTSIDFVHINAHRRDDGILLDGVAEVEVENQLSRKPIETGGWPYMGAADGHFSILNGVPVGRTGDRELWMELYQNHIFASGVTRWGKSAFLRLIVAGVARMFDAELWIIDPKDVDYTLWEPFTARYETDNAKFGKMLDDLLVIMQQRLSSMKGVTTQWKPSPTSKQIVLVIDEAADIPKEVQEKQLVRLIQKGSGAGITIIGATVRITGDQVNTTFRSQFITRVAFKTEDDFELGIILGKKLMPHISTKAIKRKGDCWVKTPERGIELARTYYMSDEDMIAYTKRLGGFPTSDVDPGQARTPDVPDSESSAKGASEREAETDGTVVVPPPVLFAEPPRVMTIWQTLAESVEPLSKAEVARRVGLLERGSPFDKNALKAEFARLEELGLMKMGHAGRGHMSGFVAVVPPDMGYRA